MRTFLLLSAFLASTVALAEPSYRVLENEGQGIRLQLISVKITSKTCKRAAGANKCRINLKDSLGLPKGSKILALSEVLDPENVIFRATLDQGRQEILVRPGGFYDSAVKGSAELLLYYVGQELN